MNSGINPKEKDYELARENTVAMNCHFLVCGIISIAYFVEFLKGDGTLLYVLATIILAMGPVVGEIICYKKQHDTKMIKHFVGIGYAILYTFVMFTTNNHFTFVYVIPMLIAITVYNDFKYSLPIEVGVVIVNVIQLALFFKRGIYTKADMASVEIQFFVIVLICGIQLYVSIVAEKLNQKKLAELKAEHEKTEELLTRIMDTSDKMTQQITESAQKTASLGESMQAMKESMEEVNSGSNDTAEAVQSQLNQTEEIQAMVEQVEKGTENIIDNDPEGPYIQTFIFENAPVMIGFLHKEKTSASMASTLDILKERLGEDYGKLFSLLLTDRGSEFEKHSLFEVNNETGEIRSDIFYCDPQMPSQKPHVENNHNYVRNILPNGVRLDKLTYRTFC